MKKGKWNYSEDIEFDVILVSLHKVEKPPMHWQNAFVGQERQIIRVVHPKSNYTFYMDNQDGSGLKKIEKLGGPDSYHASIQGFDFIREVPENEWQKWNEVLYITFRAQSDEWAIKNFPEEHKRLEGLRKSIQDMQKSRH